MEAFLRMFKSRVALDQMSAPKQTTIDRPSYRQAEAVESSHAPEEIFPSRPPPRISRAPSSIASPHLSFPPLSQGTIVTNDITFDPTTTSNTNGGFGDLFVGFHRKQGKVALKRLGVRHNNDKNRRHLEKEAVLWQTLSHPFILRFLGVIEHQGHSYLVSPFVEHGSLPSYLVSYPNADRHRLIADGLAYLHDRRVIHGDVKGANTLVSYYHHALLCDFGLAKMVDTRTSSSLAGAGRLQWQAPELFDGISRTAMSDIYAFGITIAGILSGEVPFHDHNPAAVINAVYNRDDRPPLHPMTSPSGVPYTRLWSLATRCWTRKPEAGPTARQASGSLYVPFNASGVQEDDALLSPAARREGHARRSSEEPQPGRTDHQAAASKVVNVWNTAYPNPAGPPLRALLVPVDITEGRLRDHRGFSDMNEVTQRKEPDPLQYFRPPPELADRPKRPAVSRNRRFRETQDSFDIDQDIELAERALALRPEGHPNHATALYDLAKSLYLRSQHGEDPSDIDRAVACEERRIALLPGRHPDYAEALQTLIGSVYLRYKQSEDPSDIDQAIQLSERVLGLQPKGHVGHMNALWNLALYLRKRFMQNQDPADIDETIELWERVLALRPNREEYAEALKNLAVSLHERYAQSQTPSDIDQDIKLSELVLALRPEGDPQHEEALQSLAISLGERFKRSQDPSDINRAIELSTRVLALRPAGHPEHAEARQDLVDFRKARDRSRRGR